MHPKFAVLDTNICLDLFVFHDRDTKPLQEAINNRNIIAITREDCREEWLRVLDYPKLALNDTEKARSIQDFDAQVKLVSPEKRNYHLLPVCSDRDDQKFMEVAYDSHASYLITKDRALLKLNRRNRKIGQFNILTPLQWNKLDNNPDQGN